VIRIYRPSQAPKILKNRGVKATIQLCEQVDASRHARGRKAIELKFDRTIYGSKSVKNALLKAQHDKCAYCEAKGSHVAHGDVEHFRPKGGYQETRDTLLIKPGYYWLAYDWSNLLFCCQICNQTHKRNQFPLVDESRRARSHKHAIHAEEPLLIDPSSEDPAKFMDFHEEYIRAIDGDKRGEATIAALGLNRDKMIERRRDALAKLKLLVKSRDRLADQISQQPNAELIHLLDEITRHLQDCVSSAGEYAAMARAALRDLTRTSA
jgi:uncharacterized protein (TIGR02646 family)